MLSLIVTPEKQDGKTRFKKALRDISEDEFSSLLMEHGCDPTVAVERTNYEEERGKISVIAPVRCKPKTPKSMAFKVGSQRVQYRGPIIVAGTGDGAGDRTLPKAFYRGLKVEPRYKDDAICLPSLAEWLALPEPLGKTLRSHNWIWLRDTGPKHSVWTFGKIGAIQDVDLEPGTTDNGGIVSFIDLKKLPEKAANKIRARFHPVTDDIYAIGANERMLPGMASRWQEFYRDTTKEDCYDNSFIRRYLNEEYLPKLIEAANK